MMMASAARPARGGDVLAIPFGGASIYAGVVTLNALAAASGAAASLLPGGDPKSL